MTNDSSKAEKRGFEKGFWSKDQIKEIFLDEQRRYMWNRDYWRRILVPLFNLNHDSVILDVGCGLGYIGRVLSEFVPDGEVIGVDLDAKLIETAKSIVDNGDFKSTFDFRMGSVLELPVDSDSVDLSICQCVLMHLHEPIKAVMEMRRVTKNEGRVVAIEADYSCMSTFDSAIEKMNYAVEERAKLRRWEMITDLGKKELGMGDNQVGLKLPYLFSKAGLQVLDVRSTDLVLWLVPPYDHEENALLLKHLMIPPESWFENLNIHAQFLAGGGTEGEWTEYLNLLKKEHEIRMQQIQEKSYVGSQYMATVVTTAKKI